MLHPSSTHRSIADLCQHLPHPPLSYAPGDEEATAFLCYSSGTTGRSKGVDTSHRNVVAQCQTLCRAQEYNIGYEPLHPTRDVILGVLPFGHIYGLSVIVHHPLVMGVPVVVLPKFDEVPVYRAIERFKITWALIVPPILIVLLHSTRVSNHNITSLRGCMSGAAPLSADLQQAIERKFPHVSVTQGWGLTENTSCAHVMTIAESRGKYGLVGHPLPSFETRLVSDETGEDVGVGERGEVWLRGPNIMKGYWRNEEATSRSFAPGRWFKTGDVGVVDAHGHFA